MPDIHVLTNKSQIDPQRLPGSIAIVMDVLFATTGMTIALDRGADTVIPTLDADDARACAAALPRGSAALVGEINGEPIEGFTMPWPRVLASADFRDKAVVYSTTNGSVALKMAAAADIVIAAGLINGAATAEFVRSRGRERNVVLVCAGVRAAFSLEDFYGAGYLASLLASVGGPAYRFTDAALAARLVHDGTDGLDCLTRGHTGQDLLRRHMREDLAIAARKSVCSIVPVLREGRLERAVV
ncbi:MAG: 2-phosphosulfolactate phosphatase [Dehalococcoidia bacterium]